MGLTIHYQLSVGRNLTAAVVRELTQRAAQYARKVGCLEVDAVRPAFPGSGADLFVSVGKPEDGCFGLVPPTDGWLLEVWPGQGSESATFGLCQYPRRTHFRNLSVPTGYTRGWLLRARCKTQYAGEHGCEHFLRCHKLVISLLDFWRELGVAVLPDQYYGWCLVNPSRPNRRAWHQRPADTMRLQCAIRLSFLSRASPPAIVPRRYSVNTAWSECNDGIYERNITLHRNVAGKHNLSPKIFLKIGIA
jgi:hypothetical protein